MRSMATLWHEEESVQAKELQATGQENTQEMAKDGHSDRNCSVS